VHKLTHLFYQTFTIVSRGKQVEQSSLLTLNKKAASIHELLHQSKIHCLVLQADQHPLSPIIGSTNLIFIRSLLDLSGASFGAKLFIGSKGLPLSVVSTILLIISRISLILGRVFACLTKQQFATAASFWAVLMLYFPSSLGSKINLNFLAPERCGLTHSKSFCSFFGRFLSKGRLPVISSYRKTPKLHTSLLEVRRPVRIYSGAAYPIVPTTCLQMRQIGSSVSLYLQTDLTTEF